jgi:GNAT superfamily N-acetyltransferase
MEIAEFASTHIPALERDEARHNLILALTAQAAQDPSSRLRYWSLGDAGACAVQFPGRPIILGDVDATHCARLADETRDLDHAGAIGPDETALRFVEVARKLGRRFLDPMPQKIHALRGAPHYPTRDGTAHTVTAADVDLFATWTLAFSREATPHDPQPSPEALQKGAASGRYMFWTVDGTPVSLAGIVRRTRRGVAIASVYTPPELRGRGYAGAVTAALVERAYAEGKEFACLYTDLRNPAANRCYAHVGFTPICESWFFPAEAGLQS